MLGGDVAPNRAALADVPGSGRRNGHDENIACDFGTHQPMRGLGVYLERVVVIELFWVQ